MKHLALLFVTLFCWFGFAPAQAKAVSVVVSTGRPAYPYAYRHHRHWVPGHRWHHRWIPGHWTHRW